MKIYIPYFVLRIFWICLWKEVEADTTSYSECGINHCISCDKLTNLCDLCESPLVFSKENLLCINVPFCPEGKFRINRSPTCKDCDPTCKICFANSPTVCEQCIDGYTFINTKVFPQYTCASCGIPNCKRCDSVGLCDKCFDGYSLNPNTQKCDPCQVEFCLKCSKSASICDICIASHSLQSSPQKNQICKSKVDCPKENYSDLDTTTCLNQCDISCDRCYGAGDKNCFVCAPGFFLQDQACLRCSPHCLTCKHSSSYCTSCENSLVLNGSKCTTSCKEREYKNGGQCELCPPNCSECTDYNTCSTCSDPLRYIIVDHKCQGICQSGYYNKLDYDEPHISPDLNCKKCNANCKECAINSTRCTACHDSYTLSADSVCISQCPPGNYSEYNALLKESHCLPCQDPCLKCSDRLTCLSCSSDYETSLDGRCNFKGYVINNCADGQVNFTGLCLDKCPIGTDLFGGYCQCHYSCNTNYCTFDFLTQASECYSCANPFQFSYQGICYTQCPSQMFEINKQMFIHNGYYSYKSCVNVCPNSFLQQISLVNLTYVKQCVSSCSSGFTLINNQICLKLPCSQNYYFDKVAFSLDKPSAIQIVSTDLKKYCMQCDSGCSVCDGDTSTHQCLNCIPNYLSQNQIIADGSVVKVCLKTCEKGYFPQASLIENDIAPQTCVLCTSKCQTCADGYYQIDSRLLLNGYTSTPSPSTYLYNCYQSCPTGTIAAKDGSKTCTINTTASVYLDQTGSVDNYFCVQSIIPVVFQINTIVNFSSNIQVGCNIAELKRSLLMLKSPSGGFSKYLTSIPENTLKEGNTYTIECSTIINGDIIGNSVSLKTFELMTGLFTVNAKKGFATNETFSFTISHFSLNSEIRSNSYQLQYTLAVEIPNTLNIWTNQTIFTTNPSFYSAHPELATNLNYVQTFTFPQTPQQQTIRVFLNISGVSALSRTFILYIDITPNSQTNNINIVSPIISSIIQNIGGDSNIPLTFTQLSQFAAKLIISNVLTDLDLNNPRVIVLEKMFSNKLLVNPITCNAALDCTNQGTCKSDIISYYDKCHCNIGYAGENCSWKQIDLDLVQKIFRNSLNSINSQIYSLNVLPSSERAAKLDDVLDSLNNISGIRDAFDQRVTPMLFDMLKSDALYQSTTTLIQSQLLLQINDKALDILRKTMAQSKVTSDTINSMKSTFGKSLFAQQQFLNSGEQYQFSLNNVNGIVKDLSTPQGSHDVNVQSDADTWNLNIPASVIGSQGNSLFAQVIAWPSDLEIGNQDQNSTNFNIIASNILDITLNRKSNYNTTFSVSSTSLPISITLKRLIFGKDIHSTGSDSILQCQYQTIDGSWTKEGLTMITQNETSITCQTNHLTKFAIAFQSNGQKITPKSSLDVSSNAFDFKVFSVVNFIVLLMVLHIFMTCVILRNAAEIKIKRLHQNSLKNNKAHDKIKKKYEHDQNNELKLQGVNFVSCNNEIPMVEGVPQIGGNPSNDEENKKREGEINRKLEIKNVDISDGNLLKHDLKCSNNKVALNIARRVKEAEIDLFNSPDYRDDKTNQKEINIIPISTFYSPQQLKGAFEETNTADINKGDGQPKQIPFQHKIEIEENIPCGVPVTVLEQIINPLNSESDPNAVVPKINDTNIFYMYHPLYSFTRRLENASIPVRVTVFFEFLALYEYLTLIQGINTKGHFQMSSLSEYGRNLLFVAYIKVLFHFAVLLFLSIASCLEKICFSQTRISNSQFIKYLFSLGLMIYALSSVVSKSNYINTQSQFYAWLFTLIANIFIDLFILENLFLRIPKCFKSKIIIMIIKHKSLDAIY